MVLKKYSIDSEQRRVTLFCIIWRTGDSLRNVHNSKDSSLGQKTVDNLINEYKVENGEKQIQVKEYEVKNTKEKKVYSRI